MLVLRIDQPSAHHRREGSRDEARQQNADRQGEGELPEDLANRAAREPHRSEYRGKRDGGGNHREADLITAKKACVHRRHPGVDVALDVFDLDDGIVHHQADREDQRQQREDVDGETQQIDEHQRAQQGQRDRGQRDQAGAERADEREYHHKHETGGDENRANDFHDRVLHRAGRVERHVDHHAGRRDVPQIRQHCRRRLAYVERIGGGLRHQADGDRGLAAVTKATERCVRSNHRSADSGQPDNEPVLAATQRQAIELGLVVERGIHQHRDRIVFPPDLATGRLDVLLRQRRFDVVHGDAKGGHSHRVELQADGVFAIADKLRLRHAGDCSEPRHHLSLHEGGHRHVALLGIGECEVKHGLAVGADLRDHRRDTAGRQLGLRGGHLRAHVIQRRRRIDAGTEAHRDGAEALLAARGHRLNAVRGPDRRFELGGQLAFHQFGIGSGKSRYDRDGGQDEPWELADLQVLSGPQAEDRHDQIDNDGEDRPLDAEIGKPHQAALFASACGATTLTVSPSRSRNWPTVTTCSPAVTPVRSSTCRPSVRPRVTGRRWAIFLSSTTNT